MAASIATRAGSAARRCDRARRPARRDPQVGSGRRVTVGGSRALLALNEGDATATNVDVRAVVAPEGDRHRDHNPCGQCGANRSQDGADRNRADVELQDQAALVHAALHPLEAAAGNADPVQDAADVRR